MLRGDTFKLVVNTLNQDSIFVDTSNTMKIYELKQKISVQTGVSVPTFSLIAGGTELEDENTVEFYDIQPQSTIHMVIKAIGGR